MPHQVRLLAAEYVFCACVLLSCGLAPSSSPSTTSAGITYVFHVFCAEKNALLDFKRSMDDNPLLSSWQRRRDMCSEFLGVSCNDNGHVIALYVPQLSHRRTRCTLA